VEKLLLGAMAEAIDGSTAPALDQAERSVTLKDVDEVLRRYDILVPRGGLVSAQRALLGKELIFGPENMRFAIDFLRLWVRQHERLEWVKEELSTELEELRQIAEAETSAAEQRRARRRFRWGALVGGVALVIALFLFVPGSPLRVFSASTVAEEIKVVAKVPLENKCGFQTQTQGAILATCLESVEKLSDKTIRLNVRWHANVSGGEITAVGRGESKVGDPTTYLQDGNGNIYNFKKVGGSAAAQFFLRHGQSTDGWFLFPPLAEGITAVTLVDEDTNTRQKTMINFDIASQ